jgi:hypothetical protein
VTSSATLARPPQPSCRMRSRMSRISMSRCGVCVSDSIRSLPHRSHSTRRNHDGKALNGSSKASWPEGSGWLPQLRQWRGEPAGPASGRAHHAGKERLDLGRSLEDYRMSATDFDKMMRGALAAPTSDEKKKANPTKRKQRARRPSKGEQA